MTSRGSGRTVVFTGGGTAGHVFPGLAVAEELRPLGWRLAWIGRSGGIEERLARGAELEFRAVAARPIVDRGLLARTAALAVLALSTFRATRLLRRLDAALVFATGGFVSAPAALAARLCGCRLYLLEPNASSGVANRALSRLANEAGVAFESTAAQLACTARVVGVPVRSAFQDVGGPPLADDRTHVLVLGGSKGSEALNRGLPALFARAAKRRPIKVMHQSGWTGVEDTRSRYDRLRTKALEATVVPFIDEVAEAMAAHDLIVSRAGAVTVAEVASAGRPAIYVPLPLAAGHQRGNAQAMVAAGAAILVEQDGLDDAEAAEQVSRLVADRERLARMARAARAHGGSDAAGKIARRLSELAAGGRCA